MDPEQPKRQHVWVDCSGGYRRPGLVIAWRRAHGRLGGPRRNPPRFISSRDLGEIDRFAPSTRRQLVPTLQSPCLTRYRTRVYVGWLLKPLTSPESAVCDRLSDSHTPSSARVAQSFFHKGRYRSMCRAGGDAISACEFLHRGKNVTWEEHTLARPLVSVDASIRYGRARSATRSRDRSPVRAQPPLRRHATDRYRRGAVSATSRADQARSMEET
jgi:hypothetical protein